MALVDVLTQGLASGVAAGVGPVVIRTNLNADSPIILTVPEPGGDPQPEAPPSLLMQLLKPEINTSVVGSQMTWAPYGTPSANYTPLLLAGAALTVFTLLGIGGTIGRFARPRTLVIVGLMGFAAIAAVASRTKLEDSHQG